MKTTRFVAAILCCVMTVSWVAACKKEPHREAEQPQSQEQALEYDVVFDMKDYEFFSQIFEEGQWEEKGPYTMLLSGLDTPVTLEMDGLTVKTVSAYGHTLTLNQETFQDDVGVEIESAEGVVVIYQTYDCASSCWLLTEEDYHVLPPVEGYSTRVQVREDGSLGYRKSWDQYDTTFNQEDYAPLYYCTSRNHMLYQIGSAEFLDNELVLAPEKTVTVDDEYDLESLFAEAKADAYAGDYFSQFETVDQALAANENRAG